jgi:hypothetical protein
MLDADDFDLMSTSSQFVSGAQPKQNANAANEGEAMLCISLFLFFVFDLLIVLSSLYSRFTSNSQSYSRLTIFSFDFAFRRANDIDDDSTHSAKVPANTCRFSFVSFFFFSFFLSFIHSITVVCSLSIRIGSECRRCRNRTSRGGNQLFIFLLILCCVCSGNLSL